MTTKIDEVLMKQEIFLYHNTEMQYKNNSYFTMNIRNGKCNKNTNVTNRKSEVKQMRC